MHSNKIETDQVACTPPDVTIIATPSPLVHCEGHCHLKIVDGQHRVAAFRRIASRYTDLADRVERGL